MKKVTNSQLIGSQDSSLLSQLSRTQAALRHSLQAFKSRAFSCTHSQLVGECEDVLSGQAIVRTTGVDQGSGKPSKLDYEFGEMDVEPTK